MNLAYTSNHREVLNSGIVAGLSNSSITVAFDKWLNQEIDIVSKTFCLIQTVNDVTHRRLLK